MILQRPFTHNASAERMTPLVLPKNLDNTLLDVVTIMLMDKRVAGTGAHGPVVVDEMVSYPAVDILACCAPGSKKPGLLAAAAARSDGRVFGRATMRVESVQVPTNRRTITHSH
ncbi:hypothetical protein MRB53_039533 [Persea americana]|nr:hypothetical protein MRB53_039533 [Persea americana]